MTVTIRVAGPGDFDAVGALSVAAYRRGGHFDDDGAAYARQLADAAGRARDAELLVAVDAAGAVCGTVMFVPPGTRYSELAGAREAEFRMLAVDPAAQGRGVGSALVRACLERATAAGYEAVVICVRDFAADVHRLYERLGFTRLPARDWSPVPGVALLAYRIALPAPARR